MEYVSVVIHARQQALILRPFELSRAGNVAYRAADAIDQRLDHALRLASHGHGHAVIATSRLRAHSGQDVVAGREADEQAKGDKPDAESKV